jgi:hypothetical protein
MCKLFSIFLILLAGELYSQPFKSIIIETADEDEPPTLQNRDNFRIEYRRNKQGGFEASYFTKNGNKILLPHPYTIEKDKIDVFENWTRSDKKKFVSSDFQIDDEVIFSYLDEHKINLNFKPKQSIQIKVDSFSYCQSQNMLIKDQIGGYAFRVILYPTGKHLNFSFNSSDIGANKFELQHYLFYYHLLKKNLPQEFPNSKLFSEDNFKYIISCYLQTVECEDHYYRAFITIHPERSVKQNRTRDGWNFQEYLKNIGKVY